MVQWFTRQTSHMISLTFGCHGEERSHLVAVLLLSAVRLGVPYVCIYIFASCRFSPPEGPHISVGDTHTTQASKITIGLTSTAHWVSYKRWGEGGIGVPPPPNKNLMSYMSTATTGYIAETNDMSLNLQTLADTLMLHMHLLCASTVPPSSAKKKTCMKSWLLRKQASKFGMNIYIA